MRESPLEGLAVQPTLAVVVVNYNYGRYFAETLVSVLGQTNPLDKVIGWNDSRWHRADGPLLRGKIDWFKRMLNLLLGSRARTWPARAPQSS